MIIEVILKIIFLMVLVLMNPISFENLFAKDGDIDVVVKSLLLLINLTVLALYYFFFFYKNDIYNFYVKLKIFSFNLFLLMFLVMVLELSFGNWIIKNNINHLNITKNASYEYQLNNLY